MPPQLDLGVNDHGQSRLERLTLSFGGGVTPLTDLHQPNDPAEFDTTGSTDSTHTHGAGLPKNPFTASFLGSKCPIAGTCCAITAAIGPTGNQTTKTYPQAVLTQMSISGRKDARIEGNLTAMPGDTSLTATTNTWTIASDSRLQWLYVLLLGHGPGRHHLGQLHLERHSDRDRRRKRQRQPARSRHSRRIDHDHRPGQPGPGGQGNRGHRHVLEDGGLLGSWTHAKLMSTHSGGSLDGQVTTELVFKPILSTTTATG